MYKTHYYTDILVPDYKVNTLVLDSPPNSTSHLPCLSVHKIKSLASMLLYSLNASQIHLKDRESPRIPILEPYLPPPTPSQTNP